MIDGTVGLAPRWASGGFYTCQWGPLQDQNPHFILAAHAVATATGDKAWLTNLLPAIEAVAAYMETAGLGSSGVFTCPASGLGDGGKHTTNWYDIIEFGHLDAYNAVLAVWAVDCLADMYEWLGNHTQAVKYYELHTRAVAAYNTVFWSDSHGAYADWVDVTGTPRWYFYSDTQFKAVFLGVANATQAGTILRQYDALLAGLLKTYNVTADDVWAPPCNLIPVSNRGDVVAEVAGNSFPYGAWPCVPACRARDVCGFCCSHCLTFSLCLSLPPPSCSRV